MKHAKLLLLAFGGLLAGIFLAEGLAHMLLPPPTKQIAVLRMRAPDLQMDAGTDLANPNYNPFLQRRPHSDWVCDGKNPERMNNEGFRDEDFVLQKTSDKIRIAVIGDSFTEGWMGPRDMAFPRLLEARLAPQFEVMNFGLANRSPLRYVALYEQIVRKYRPDVVLVCIYRNDLAEDEALAPYVTLSKEGIPLNFDFKRYFKNTPRMPQTRWEKRHDRWQWMACKYSRLYPYAAVMAMDPEFRHRVLEAPPLASFETQWPKTAGHLLTLVNLLKKDGVLPLLTYVPDGEDFVRPHPLQNAIPAFAKDQQVSFLKLDSFLRFGTPSDLYIPGDGHFSAQGHLQYAGLLVEWIKAQPSRQGETGRVSLPIR